ncbi:hypothetical protein ACFE04_007243 [Oxalis oulophora]
MSDTNNTTTAATTDLQPMEDTKPKPTNPSLRIWPPTQRTRDAVISRLIETLSQPSVLSKRFGTISADEAAVTARSIEEEAFAAAGSKASAEDDGIETLQVYSRDISKRMLDSMHARANAPEEPVAANGGDDGGEAAVSTISEDVSSSSVVDDAES